MACADLSLDMTVCPAPPGQYLVYALTVRNAGPDAAEEVVITDTVPGALGQGLYSLNWGWDWLPWPGSLLVGRLPAGDRLTLLLAGVAPQGGAPLVNAAAAVSRTPDPALRDNAAALVTRPLR